ncbi:MAG: hypothetical protein D6811_05105 [Alphaproteobacteria bacterium]|nr:MAG: hypothetical protein D6811_05105 [Alphaproteobacteria bacterium]
MGDAVRVRLTRTIHRGPQSIAAGCEIVLPDGEAEVLVADGFAMPMDEQRPEKPKRRKARREGRSSED